MLQAEAPRLQSLCASQQPSRCSRPDSILSDEPDAGWGVPQHGRNAPDEEGRTRDQVRAHTERLKKELRQMGEEMRVMLG